MRIDEKKLQQAEAIISKIADAAGKSFGEILQLLDERKSAKEFPVSIFDNQDLSALEAIVKYMKEELLLDYKQISTMLNRNYDPIAITYRRAKKKHPDKLDPSSEQTIPVSIFQDKKLSVLENIAMYLLSLNLTYHQIASIINRDERTVWTVCHRARLKQDA